MSVAPIDGLVLGGATFLLTIVLIIYLSECRFSERFATLKTSLPKTLRHETQILSYSERWRVKTRFHRLPNLGWVITA